MIFSTFLNLFIIITIIGYGYLFKLILIPKIPDKNFYNEDILFGVFFLIFLSLVLNFFSPLKFFLIPILLIGFLFFIKCVWEKNLKINLLIYIFFLFFLTFITYGHGDNVDSPMYHLQIIKWINNEKIVVGLPNLEIRFGSNSLWFYLISLFQIKFDNFNSIFIFNFIPLAILFYETINHKKKVSYIFLVLCVCFLLFFSYLHPFANGIIFNHLRNPEVDISGMVFFILSIYFFLDCLEKENLDKFRLLILSSIICLLIKISYLGVIFFPTIILIIYFKSNILDFILNRFNLFILFVLVLWLVRNTLISGCVVFPVSITCFETAWSIGIEQIDQYSKIIKSYARDTPDRSRYSDFNYTIYSIEWFLPWFKEYALKNALLKITFFIIILSSLFLFLFKYFGKLNNIYNKKIYYFAIFALSINFLFWFQAPEIRFGWGIIISLACFPLSIFIFYNKYFEYFKTKYFIHVILIFILLMFVDNQSNLNLKNLVSSRNKDFTYSKIVKFDNYLGKDFYFSKDWKCYDFKEICVNIPKKNYNLIEKKGYLVFLNKQ